MKFSGIVQRHLGRGQVLGFPTANIEPPAELPDGLYVGWAWIESENSKLKHQALIFLGANPTFNESFRRAEIYLLDFIGDLYDQKIEVEALEKIREVERFDTKEALIEQMKKDEMFAREFFKKYNKPN